MIIIILLISISLDVPIDGGVFIRTNTIATYKIGHELANIYMGETEI